MSTFPVRVSRRVAGIRPLALAGLLPLAAASGAVDLALGVPPDAPPAPAVDRAVLALRGGRNQYTPAAGLDELRAQIAAELARTRGASVDPQRHVTVTSGSAEGVLAALLAVTDPGDEVLMVEPFFEIYPGAVALCGAVPRYVPLTPGSWRLDPAVLRRAVTTRTRAVLLNTPHNPTGRVFGRAEVEAVRAVCAEYGLVCITDETYDSFVFDGDGPLSPWDLPDGRPRTVLVGSLSKSLRISGWRLGYCVAEEELTHGLRRAHEHLTLGAATPLQHGAAAGLAQLRGVDAAALHNRLVRRRDQLASGLARLGFGVTVPEGGWFLLADTAPLRWSSSRLAERLVREAGVLTAPGTAFFDDPTDGERWLRVCLVRDEETTAVALDRIGGFLRSAGHRSGSVTA